MKLPKVCRSVRDLAASVFNNPKSGNAYLSIALNERLLA